MRSRATALEALANCQESGPASVESLRREMRTTSTWSSAVQVAVRGLPLSKRNLAEVAAARQIGEHQFAARTLFGNLHEPDANEIKAVGRIALAADHLAGCETQEFHPVAQVVDELLA